jgi:osmotically-inducible protein OsmY
MSTPLQSTNITADEVTSPIVTEHAEGEEGHIHLPSPSFWPILLSVAIALTVGGLILWSKDSFPWLSVIAAPFVIVGILGWGLEDPMATSEDQPEGLATSYAEAAATGKPTALAESVLQNAEEVIGSLGLGLEGPMAAPRGEGQPEELATSYAEAAASGKPTALAELVLQNAEEVVERIVTISSTAWSAHPVRVFVEREGVVLSLYGKVEREEQKKELEDALRKLPGVIDVMNFIVAEDVVERTETTSSSAWSANSTKVFVEREGVVLSLYGKVELEEQKKELEDELRKLPGVIDVMNFIVAEDAILNMANARIANLKESGKLEGAKDISVLVENYILSLYGEVPKPEMKYVLEKEMVGIPGVRVVINHIGLNENIPGNLGKTTNRVGP